MFGFVDVRKAPGLWGGYATHHYLGPDAMLLPLPAGLEQDILLRQLEPLARSAQVFFLMTDDPVKYRIEVGERASSLWA